jgi:hypothetical protein
MTTPQRQNDFAPPAAECVAGAAPDACGAGAPIPIPPDESQRQYGVIRKIPMLTRGGLTVTTYLATRRSKIHFDSVNVGCGWAMSDRGVARTLDPDVVTCKRCLCKMKRDPKATARAAVLPSRAKVSI